MRTVVWTLPAHCLGEERPEAFSLQVLRVKSVYAKVRWTSIRIMECLVTGRGRNEAAVIMHWVAPASSRCIASLHRLEAGATQNAAKIIVLGNASRWHTGRLKLESRRFTHGSIHAAGTLAVRARFASFLGSRGGAAFPNRERSRPAASRGLWQARRNRLLSSIQSLEAAARRDPDSTAALKELIAVYSQIGREARGDSHRPDPSGEGSARRRNGTGLGPIARRCRRVNGGRKIRAGRRRQYRCGQGAGESPDNFPQPGRHRGAPRSVRCLRRGLAAHHRRSPDAARRVRPGGCRCRDRRGLRAIGQSPDQGREIGGRGGCLPRGGQIVCRPERS